MDSRANLAQTLLDNQATAVLWLDVGLRLGYLNPAAETLLQLDARKVLGSPVRACLPEAGEFVAALSRAAERRETFTQRELKLPRGPAEARSSVTVDCTATPWRKGEGETPLLVELAAAGPASAHQPRRRPHRPARRQPGAGTQLGT